MTLDTVAPRSIAHHGSAGSALQSDRSSRCLTKDNMSQAIRSAIVNPVRWNGSIQAPWCSVENRQEAPAGARRAKHAAVFGRTLNTTATTLARMRDGPPDGGADAVAAASGELKSHAGAQGMSPLRQAHTFIVDARSPTCS